MCGLMGVIGHPKAVEVVRSGLHALNNRGQESAAIAYYEGDNIRRIGGMGLVSEALPDVDNLPSSNTAIGHVRYSTTGSSTVDNLQPIFNEPKTTVLAHNGNITNAKKLHDSTSKSFHTSTDSEIVLNLLDDNPTPNSVGNALLQVEGAYCFLLMTPERVMAIRDPLGFRPLCLGYLDDSIILSSESCAIEAVGGKFLRDIKSGEIFSVNRDGVVEITRFGSGLKRAQCIFELIYFSDPASTVFGHNVHLIRHKMGEVLGAESPVIADMVVPVPHSGIDAAMGYAKITELPLGRAFTTNNYAGRSFTMPDQTSRERKVASKLHVITDVVRGKRICLIEDSIVRGTTMKALVSLLKKSGAKEVHLRVASPPIKNGCYYGIDFPDKSKLIANNRGLGDIRRYLQVNSVSYISVDGMLRCVDEPAKFCTACFTANYPTKIDLQIKKSCFEPTK